MKFVSLFAGVGGFDLGLESAGFTCVGQCEIEPHAQAVLRHRWPHVPKHDDVTTLKHDTFPHPDVVTFGSPCQDLSVAGKRAGIQDGTRSGLFTEAVRYIRDVQEATHGELPRVAVWENVPGAFSSNKGADFAAVLAHLVGGDVRTPASGWRNAGVAFGPLGSAEWRVLDSRYFGVAQRRRRVFVVYRPRSERAGDVLLEPEGMRGHPEPSRASRSGPAGSAARGPVAGSGDVVTALTGGLGSGGPDAAHAQAGWLVPVAFKVRGGVEVDSGGKAAGKGYLGSDDISLTLSAVQDQFLAEPQPFAFQQNQRDEVRSLGPQAGALAANAGVTQQNYVALPIQDGRGLAKSQNGAGVGNPGDPAYTLDTVGAQAVAFAMRGREDGIEPEVHEDGRTVGALRASAGGSTRDYVATFAPTDYRTGSYERTDLAQAITTSVDRTRAAPIAVTPEYPLPTPIASWENGVGNTQVATGFAVPAGAYAVRRLTPRECERLQAFPDDWTSVGAYDGEIKRVADSHRYRMMGNAVTVSVIAWIAHRLARVLPPEGSRVSP